MSLRGLSAISSESSTVVVVVVGSVGISAGVGSSCRASVVLAVGGLLLWSVGVGMGMLVCKATSRFCSYASASNQKII